jgi:hypothetical protein
MSQSSRTIELSNAVLIVVILSIPIILFLLMQPLSDPNNALGKWAGVICTAIAEVIAIKLVEVSINWLNKNIRRYRGPRYVYWMAATITIVFTVLIFTHGTGQKPKPVSLTVSIFSYENHRLLEGRGTVTLKIQGKDPVTRTLLKGIARFTGEDIVAADTNRKLLMWIDYPNYATAHETIDTVYSEYLDLFLTERNVTKIKATHKTITPAPINSFEHNKIEVFPGSQSNITIVNGNNNTVNTKNK